MATLIMDWKHLNVDQNDLKEVDSYFSCLEDKETDSNGSVNSFEQKVTSSPLQVSPYVNSSRKGNEDKAPFSLSLSRPNEL